MKKIIQYIISLGLIVFFVWKIYNGFTPDQRASIIDNVLNVSPFYITGIFLMSVLACLVRAYRWRQLIEPMGYRPNIGILTAAIFIMYLANFVVPRLGEVLRCSILAKYEKIPIEKSIGTMVVERVVDVLSMGLVLLITLLLEYQKLVQIYNQYLLSKKEGSSPLLLILGGLSVLLFAFFLVWKNEKFKSIIKEKITGFWTGIISVKDLKNPALFVFNSFVINFLYFISGYFFFYSFAATASLPLKSAFLVLVSNTLGVAITPNGLGASQIFITQALGLYGIASTDGMAYSWGLWIFSAFSLKFGGIVS